MLFELEKYHKKIFQLSKMNLNLELMLEKSTFMGIKKDVVEKETVNFNNNLKKIEEYKSKILEIINKTEHSKYEYWVEMNIKTCKSIFEIEQNKKNPDSTRIFSARETVQEWREKILEKKYLIPNTYYLYDYFDFYDEIVKKTPFESEQIILAKKNYEYTFEKKQGKYIFTVHQAGIELGRDIIDYISENEFNEYEKNKDIFIQKKIKQLSQNPQNYKIRHWR